MPRAALAGSGFSPLSPLLSCVLSGRFHNIMEQQCDADQIKAISEVVAAIAILNQNAPVSLPVPRPLG